MRVVIVNTFDIQGGAARAAYRLHQSLQSQDIDSKMVVQNKMSNDSTVLVEGRKLNKYFNKLRPIIDSIPVRFYRKRTKVPYSASWVGFGNIVDLINELAPDIVHLHWVCGGMLTIEDLVRIKAPIVWSIHDSWAFTGGCHTVWDCVKYKVSCGACPLLGSSDENDLSRKIWRRKQNAFGQINNMTIVGLSRWINECSKNSSLFRNTRHINLPNPIDTSVFKPIGAEKARAFFGLPKNKKLVMFGAVNGMSDINKGFSILTEVLRNLNNVNVEFVVLGSLKPEEPHDFGLPTHYLGYLNGDSILARIYSAVDIMIVPSMQENLSNAIMESLACGTPVIGFDVGGNSDLIEHKKNGYLAKPFDASDLLEGIKWGINIKLEDSISENARISIENKFAFQLVAKMYVDLYKSIIRVPEC